MTEVQEPMDMTKAEPLVTVAERKPRKARPKATSEQAKRRRSLDHLERLGEHARQLAQMVMDAGGAELLAAEEIPAGTPMADLRMAQKAERILGLTE